MKYSGASQAVLDGERVRWADSPLRAELARRGMRTATCTGCWSIVRLTECHDGTCPICAESIEGLAVSKLKGV